MNPVPHGGYHQRFVRYGKRNTVLQVVANVVLLPRTTVASEYQTIRAVSALVCTF